MHDPPIKCCDSECAAPSNRGAFTLIELLVVMAIMGIMLAMTIAIGPSVIRSSAMNSALSQVASAVSLARSEAVKERRPTVFVLAPGDAGDDRAYRAYAILKADSINATNFTYIRRWEKLPQNVFFRPDKYQGLGITRAPYNLLPYPTNGGNTRALQGIVFNPDGGVEENAYPATPKVRPQITLQQGMQSTNGAEPKWLGTNGITTDYITNQVAVQRLTGKVLVEREGEVK